MAFGLTSAAIAEYAAKPFVRQSLAKPHSPSSVLTFFLGIDYSDPAAPDRLREGKFLQGMVQFWFGGHDDYDVLCQTFASVVRDAGRKSLPDDTEWCSVEGKLAQLILCDQLSRNCFRGLDEAFAYDDTALEVSHELCDKVIFNEGQSTLAGDFYPAYATFVNINLMHSESAEDHLLGIRVCEWARERSPLDLEGWWDNQQSFTLEHKAVIDRFGRYPHRNAKKGRASTKEELEWLVNDEELPAWAKSQS